MFCPKCKSIMLPKTQNGKKVMQCSCGHVAGIGKAETHIKEKVEQSKEKMAVIENEIQPLPLIEAQCDKCGHNQAYFWSVQTRASDEPETKFFKCQKCNNVWRDYS
jgi:transcription factor S